VVAGAARLAARCVARRLFLNGKVKPDEVGDLVDLCKAAKGLSAPRAPGVLANEHLAIKDGISEAVSLVSLIHHHDANALAPEQTVTFGPKLTIVYGANAAGKSGYARILKRACRSRSTEEILGNVLSGETPTKLQATSDFVTDIKPRRSRSGRQMHPRRPRSPRSVFLMLAARLCI